MAQKQISNFTIEDFEWNDSASTIIRNLGIGKELNRRAADIFYSYEYPYIPYKEGDLSNRVTIRATEQKGLIVHGVKYANAQYNYLGDNRTRTFHPLATSFWDQAAWNNHKEQITRDIDKMRKQLSKDRRLGRG